MSGLWDYRTESASELGAFGKCLWRACCVLALGWMMGPLMRRPESWLMDSAVTRTGWHGTRYSVNGSGGRSLNVRGTSQRLDWDGDGSSVPYIMSDQLRPDWRAEVDQERRHGDESRAGARAMGVQVREPGRLDGCYLCDPGQGTLPLWGLQFPRF